MRLSRASGVLLHPTSLPGPHGSGDLGPAAHHFVDWLATAGQTLWQILPLGGIGPGNSPYMSSSAFAGNVLLIDLADLQQRGWLDVDDLPLEPAFSDERIDYPSVVPYRMERLARAARRFAQAGAAQPNAEYEGFCDAHRAWLEDYALFMALSERYGGRDWCEWHPALTRREPIALERARAEHAERIAFWKFCQWCFFAQWQRLKGHAHARGVKIVGDIPIFIACQSADVWAHPELFELDEHFRPGVIAGVPPDAFSDTGQRWGNPLYRWSAHAAQGYAWWIERIRATFELVDIVRIDHFRGFAGYWEIPATESTAMNGRWMPGPGADLFEAVAARLGPLPIIAEDLGVITPDVVALRKRFEFPGMRILQFAFGGSSANAYLPHNFDADSVVYTGTHDNDTSIGWWHSLDERQRRHVSDYLATDGSEIHWELIRAACASVANTAILPLQDVLGLGAEHRMNLPGEGRGHWEWRFSWQQVRPEHARRLHHLCALYRRDGTPDESA